MAFLLLVKTHSPNNACFNKFLQPMHFPLFRITPPPGLFSRAPEGQLSAQALSPMQAMQAVATNLPDRPPLVFILMELFEME
jgi:hypothetical protein